MKAFRLSSCDIALAILIGWVIVNARKIKGKIFDQSQRKVKWRVKYWPLKKHFVAFKTRLEYWYTPP